MPIPKSRGSRSSSKKAHDLDALARVVFDYSAKLPDRLAALQRLERRGTEARKYLDSIPYEDMVLHDPHSRTIRNAIDRALRSIDGTSGLSRENAGR